jgi:hypothetical protein
MRQPSEEEIRALEAELEKLTVDDVLLQTIVTLINLGARKLGLAEGSQADLAQAKQAIDAARALLPIVEPSHGEALGPVREALSRLQMAYVQQTEGGGAAPAAPDQPAGSEEQPGQSEGPGPAQQSGRLWVPGQ